MSKLFYLVLLLGCFGCEDQGKHHQKMVVEGFAQGTTYRVVYLSKDGVDYQRAIDSTLIEIDNSLSTYQKRSLISRFNQAEKLLQVDTLFKAVYHIAKEAHAATNGAFDPTVAPLVNAWGFGFENSQHIDSNAIDSLIQLVDFNKISLDGDLVKKEQKEMMLDFNAVAQGYSVDVLADLLSKKGIANYLVEIGGEIKAKGLNMQDTLWRIGIDKPVEGLEVREIEAIVNLENKALATSGNYRKFYEKDGVKYTHTIHPKTGYPVEHNLLSATVVTEGCGKADAYATAFMVLGLEESKKIIASDSSLEALLIYSDQEGRLNTFITEKLQGFIELPPHTKE